MASVPPGLGGGLVGSFWAWGWICHTLASIQYHDFSCAWWYLVIPYWPDRLGGAGVVSIWRHVIVSGIPVSGDVRVTACSWWRCQRSSTYLLRSFSFYLSSSTFHSHQYDAPQNRGWKTTAHRPSLRQLQKKKAKGTGGLILTAAVHCSGSPGDSSSVYCLVPPQTSGGAQLTTASLLNLLQAVISQIIRW